MLGSLALNGGTIPTMSPLPGSPAIGGGSSASNSTAFDGSCSALDERLFVRGGSGPCTIGAIEPLGVFATSYLIPAAGGAGGTVTPVIHGAAFLPGSTVVLRQSGQADVVPTSTTVAPDTHSIAVGLDLTNAAAGPYDVIVTPPTGAPSTLTAGFTVQSAAVPVINTDIIGNSGIRPGRTAIFSLIYGNSGNADAYLVPVVLSLPGTMSYTLNGKVLPPPPTTGQAIKDFSTVPMLITPLPTATSGVNNVSILIPVIPAGSSAELQFSLYLAPNSSHGDTFSLIANPGSPYATGANGTIDPVALSNLVAAARSYAETNLGVAISAQTLAKMTTYAGTQFAQEIALGKQALGATALGQPVFFSDAQLQIDVAAYGAKLQSTASATVPPLRPQPNPELLTSVDLERGLMKFTGYKHGFGPHPPSWEGYAYFGQGGGTSNNSWTVSECREAAGYSVSGNECVPDGRTCTYGDCKVHPISFPVSIDPNEKDGPSGVGSANYTLATTTFPYQVEFENEATATGAAQTVTVTDPIDTSKFDLSTFSLGAITFGAYSLNPPVGLTSYAGAVDLRPTQNVLVAVTANLDKSSGIATWTFTSLDPNTMQLTGDPNAGFLPPDTNPPVGIGRVAFNVKPLAAAPDGQICNTANIVFDLNAAIATKPYCNNKDTTPPNSQVAALSATQPSPTFTVFWSGTDTGSGVARYTIYVAQDGGPFTAWMTATTATSGAYTGISGHSYSFYSIATDLLGNIEAAKTHAEATTLIATPVATLSPSSVAFGSVAPGSHASATVTLTSTGLAPLIVSGFVLSDTANFTLSSACPAALNQGQSCAATVTFAPSASASLTTATTATLSLASNAGNAPAPVLFSGFAGTQSAANVWVVNGNQTLSQLAGSTLNTFSGGGSGIAIDHAGNVWSGNLGGSAVTEFSSTGTVLGSFIGGGISSPVAIAIDGLGVVWIANANGTVSTLTNTGAPANATPVATAGNLAPASLTIDAAGSLWIANTANNTVTEVVGEAAPIVAPTVTAVTNNTLGTEP
ncbi:hypothetical protein SAMN05421770_101887 [Granulicella rosea]|uniref:Choice-of-anchor D domain-containing protein n=2 Tax=Granulicella rosea TaxID=474952 RepID=A0A239EAW6_9BACT|nr:hypothetical protein SAMN05421770_101887 [Granulicella rosea]